MLRLFPKATGAEEERKRKSILIKNECYKVYGNITAVLFIMLVFVMNGIQLEYLENKSRTGYGKFSAEAYNTLWNDLSAKAVSDGGSFGAALLMLEDMDNALSGVRIGKIDEGMLPYTGDYTAERSLYARVKNEISFTLNYRDYIEGMYSSAERLAFLPIYADRDGFAYRKLAATPKIYESMRNTEPECAPSLGIVMAVNTDVTDVFFLAVIIYLCAALWQKEREQGLISFIRTAYKGRYALGACKLFVLAVSIMACGLIMYGTNVCLAEQTYGLGDLTRPLASVYEYGTTQWNISTGMFLVLFILLKIAAFILAGFFISMLLCMIRNSTFAITAVIAAAAVCCALYYGIDALSIFSPIKYLNPFGLMKTEHMFRGNICINFFSYPVQFRHCLAALIVLGSAVFAGLTLYCFTRMEKRCEKCGRKSAALLTERLKSRGECHTSLLRHEIYKVFVSRRLLLFFVLLTAVQIYRAVPYRVTYRSNDEYYKRYYLERLAGPLTEAKRNFFKEEEEFLKTYREDDKKARLSAFEKVKSRLEYIAENEGAYFVYEDGLEKLTGGYIKDDISAALFTAAILSAVIPCFTAPEYQNGIYKLTEVSRYGRKKALRIRYAISLVTASFVFVIVYASTFIRETLSYEIPAEYFSYPANSLPQLSMWGNIISIGLYMCICCILRLASVFIITMLIHFLAQKIKSLVFTNIAALACLALPFIAALVRQTLIGVCYPYSWLVGNIALQDRAAFIIGSMAAAAVTVMLIIRLRRKKR